MAKRKKLSPYQRIVRAHKTGNGVLLSSKEVAAMNLDDAIVRVAENEDENDADLEEVRDAD